MWECDWGEAYVRCPAWKEKWEATKGNKNWPQGIQILGRRMFLNMKLCIPTCFQDYVVHENHDFLGHVGVEKTWYHMKNRYEWADEGMAKKITESDCKTCGICQACRRGNTSNTPIESTPIPPAPMSNVAIDLFRMPRVFFMKGRNIIRWQFVWTGIQGGL